MPEFQYWATTEIGDTVTGQLHASSPDAASHLLTVRGFTVQRLEEVAAGSELRPVPTAGSVPLTEDDFAGLSTALESATETNLPLTATLRTLAEESRSPRFRRAVMSMIDALDQGQPLEKVLSQLPSAFPRRVSALVDAGVSTGKLPALMHHALEHIRRNAELRRRIRRSLAYPLLIFAVAASVIGGILLVLVPTFKRIFSDFGTELPALTKGIVHLSDLCVNAVYGIGSLWTWLGWPLATLLTLGIAAGIAGLFAFGRTPPLTFARRTWHRLLNLAPVIGPVFQTASLSNLFRLIAMLVEAGVNLPEALRLAAAVTDDAALEPKVNRIASAIADGVTPLDAVRDSEALPREVLPIFRWADNRSLFIEALRGAADIFAARTQLHTGITAIILEPALIFGIGLTVGLVFLSLFLPLIKLLNDLA